MKETTEARLDSVEVSDVAATERNEPPYVADGGTLVVRRWATSNVRRVEADGRAVYVKQYLPQGDLGVTPEVIHRRTSREMDLVKRMRSCPPPHSHLGILNLVYGDPKSGVLVTEEAPGPPVSQLVLRRSASHGTLRALYSAGKWLRWFQSLPIKSGDGERFMDDDPLDLVEYCDLRIQAILQLGYGWPTDGIRRRLKANLRQLAQRFSPEDRRPVWTHGDYSPGNVLWDGSTLTPLDFAMAKLSFSLVDVTYFIHRLEMLGIYFPWRRWPIGTWKQAILRGYGRPDAERSAMYQAMMIRHLHCRLKTYVRRPPLNLKQRIHNAWTRKCVQKRLLKMMSQA
ncbi:MAG TPA: aminoglycoside phosphotransferase family protein [Thermoguttaceae bacterium]|nr:aminoglycoside phosphotransferase family protein [Thermoguttaceae bacterium]